MVDAVAVELLESLRGRLRVAMGRESRACVGSKVGALRLACFVYVGYAFGDAITVAVAVAVAMAVTFAFRDAVGCAACISILVMNSSMESSFAGKSLRSAPRRVTWRGSTVTVGALSFMFAAVILLYKPSFS